MDELADRERGERRFVEAADDELLLARIGVDVADREDPRRRGLEARRVDDELLLLERQAPVGDRPELRAPAEQDEERVERQLARIAVAGQDGEGGELAVVLDDGFRLAGDELDAARRAQGVEPGARRFVGVEVVAAMDERDAAGRGRAVLARGDRRRHRRLGAADDDDALAGLLVQGRAVLEELRAAVAIEAVDLEPARLERADAAGDDDGLGDEARAGRRRDVEAAVVAPRDRAHLLVEMKARAERLDLLSAAAR